MIRTKPKFALITASVFALGACATTEGGTVGYVQNSYEAELTGQAVAGAGDPDGIATAQIIVTDNEDAVCYNVWNVRNLGNATGAHIHRGQPGENGPVVATLQRGTGSGWDGCITDSEFTSDVLRADPSMFYVQIHTTEYPNGAIRGQLSPD